MHNQDAAYALSKLDGVVRLDNELLVSIVGLEHELMLGPLPGYQPRRKQVTEVRKIFKGYVVGEVSLFYELAAYAPAWDKEMLDR